VIFCIKVLSYVVLLEGVPTRVTRISNNVIPLVIHVCLFPAVLPANITMLFKDVRTCL